MICWTLGITEHHNAVDNVLALVNLSLLTGHVGRYGSGLNPLRGQNNVQGGGDMGALPDRLPGFQHVENDEFRSKFDRAWGVPVPPERGWHLSQMFEAMERGDLRALYVIGENPLQSEADQNHARHLLEGLDFLVAQDLFLTKTAELAHVVLPASAAWCESEGTVTNSERRVQRVRKAIEAPAGSRDDLTILFDLAKRLGRDWGRPDSEMIWNEVRGLSPMHAGMSYARLEKHGGLQWPCYDDDHPGELFLHSRLWERPIRGPRVAFVPVEHDPPVDRLDAEFPLRLTTGRRLDEYNTGVQSSGYRSPMRRGESLDVSPEDADRYGLREGEVVRVRSRRGAAWRTGVGAPRGAHCIRARSDRAPSGALGRRPFRPSPVDEAASADRRPRVRRHRVPPARGRGALRIPGAGDGAAGIERRRGDVDAQPLLGPVRTGAGCPFDGCR